MAKNQSAFSRESNWSRVKTFRHFLSITYRSQVVPWLLLNFPELKVCVCCSSLCAAAMPLHSGCKYFGCTVKSFTFLVLSFKGKENLQMSLNSSHYDILAFPLIIIKRKCILHGSRIAKISILKFHQPPMESVFSRYPYYVTNQLFFLLC